MRTTNRKLTKLSVNKETLRGLTTKELHRVPGGISGAVACLEDTSPNLTCTVSETATQDFYCTVRG
jgi:hypothetical protein